MIKFNKTIQCILIIETVNIDHVNEFAYFNLVATVGHFIASVNDEFDEIRKITFNLD